MPDIVITPNRGTSNNPKIDFTGTSAGTIKLEVLADGAIAWNGANGSLFSIADSLSGSLMSVNDISGLPAFEVFSDNRVIVGQFGANLLLGTTTNSSNGRLQLATHTTVAGGIGFGTDIGLYRLASNKLSFRGTANAEMSLRFERTGGSFTTTWENYIPVGSTDLKWFNGADKFTLTASGNATFSGTATATQLISNASQGTAPLVVSSSTQVSNLNAQYLNGYSSDTANNANTIVRRDGSGNFSAGTITASNISSTTLTQGGTAGHIIKEYSFNLNAQSSSQFFPIRFTNVPLGAGQIHSIEVLMDSFSGGDPYNHHSVHGQVRGSGWTDLPAFYDIFHNCYQDAERSYLGFFKGTQNCTDVILYVRGGKTYYVKTPSTASVSTTALTISDSVFAIKDSNAADVSGTSANISFMLNLITASQGRQISSNIVVSGSISGSSFAAGGNTVWHAGNDGSGSGLDADLLDGYNQDTANTASAIVRRDGSGFINATAIQTSSGGSNGVRVHTNSGITASNNYMNFFTSQTSGWAFNANGTGADTNNVAVVTSGGNVGIGQTSPLQTLQLKNNGWIGIGASTGSYIPTSWQRGGNGGIILSSSANADGSGWSYGSRLVQVDYGNGLGLSIDVNYASSWTNDALFISGRSTSLGNVGIGTTDPAAKLDVNGSFKHGLVYRYPHSQIAPALNSTGWLKLATIPNNSRAKFLMRNGSANSEETLEFDVYSTYYNSGVYVIVTRNTYNYHLSEIQVQGADGQPRIVYVKCRTSDYSPTFTWQVESWNGAATIHNTEETPTSGKNFAIGTTNYLHSNYVPNVYFDGSVGIGKIPSTKFNIKEQNTGTEGFIIANWNNVNTVLVGSDASTGGGKFTLKNNSGTANIFINSAGDSYFNGGNVGIGTTAPQRKLDILGGDIMVRSTSDTGTSVVNFGSTTYYPRASIRSTGLASPVGDANLSFWTRNSGTEYERITILNNGNVGIAAPAPGYKLEVTGDAYITEALKQGNVETRSFAVTFSDGVANRATDIRFPNTYINGLIEVEVTSSYSNQNSVGVVKKIFSVGANPTNSIWNTTVARVVEAHGVAADNWTIGDFAWDATNSKYIIPVYHIVSSGNVLNINIRYFSQAAVSSPVLPTTTVSAQYTATIPAAYQTRHYVYYNDRLGIGTSAPSTLFQVAGNNVGNFRLDTNGSGGHYYQTESNARLGLGRDLITSAGHISFTMAGGSVNTLGAAITMPANSQLGFYTSNGSSLIERVRIDGSGNVGVNSTNPSTLLNVQGSFATRNFKVFTWSTLSANATQARRYEIARLGHDTVNWDSTGVFEVEIYQQYYSRPVKKRYMVSYGYPGGGVAKLVEYQNSSTSGYGANNFQVTLGTEVVTSGNFKYLPVYIDIRYYAIIDVRVNTNWNHSTTNSSPGAGLAYINESPSPTNISDFTADSVVSLTSDNNAVFESSVGVGISTTPNYKLEISGTVGLSGFSGGSYRKLATPSYWGYNNAYKSIILGSSSTTYNTNDGAVTLCFGVDISGNANGSFTGDGRELVFRNLTRFVTPNGSNDNYLNPLTFNNGSVGIAIDSPSFKFQVAGAGSIGDGAFIVSGNTASSSFYDQNTGAYLHTPGAMIRKDSSRTTPQTSEATLVLYNKNGTDATNTKLVFANNETTSTSANPVATAAIVSEKVSGTAGGWAVGNLQFLVKNGANYTNSVVVDNTGVTVAGALTVQDGTESTNTFGLKTFTKSLTITTSWSDVGISGSDLATGTYIIQVTVDNYDVSGGQYQERYSGVMSWIAGVTNSTDVDEIVLHKAGHAPNGNWINLRTVRQAPNLTMKLQIIASGNTSAADNYVFKFRRMI